MSTDRCAACGGPLPARGASCRRCGGPDADLLEGLRIVVAALGVGAVIAWLLSP
jgi:hypothetical protein